MSDDGHIYLGELALLLNRRPNTIRHWERSGRLPRRLRPSRNGPKGWRSWTPDQVEAIKEWMEAERMVPGSGLHNFDATPEKVDDLLAKLRGRTSQAEAA